MAPLRGQLAESQAPERITLGEGRFVRVLTGGRGKRNARREPALGGRFLERQDSRSGGSGRPGKEETCDETKGLSKLAHRSPLEEDVADDDQQCDGNPSEKGKRVPSRASEGHSDNGADIDTRATSAYGHGNASQNDGPVTDAVALKRQKSVEAPQDGAVDIGVKPRKKEDEQTEEHNDRPNRDTEPALDFLHS